MTKFELHPQLVKDCFSVGSFALSRLLMMNDCQYPWFILVPQRAAVREIYELVGEDRSQLLQESCILSEVLVQIYQPEKLNIAAIGNRVSQLHLHHIARYSNDVAWPSPIWGRVPALPYSDRDAQLRIVEVRQRLGNLLRK